MPQHPSTSRAPMESAIVFAIGMAVLAAGTWGWHARVFQARQVQPLKESWEHVKEDYPLPQKPADVAPVSLKAAEAVVESNPFSPQRRQVPPKTDETGHTGPAGAAQVLAPKFIYKGGINLGKRQRAIVEDTNNHKTYFLEVGQEVAGFKVLDIAENQVVLSDLHSNEKLIVSLSATPSQ